MSESTPTGNPSRSADATRLTTKAALIVAGTASSFWSGAVAFQFLRPRKERPEKTLRKRVALR